MASSYDRKFVFLSLEDKGYELVAGKTPKGHIDIEKRNSKLNFKIFLENLKEMNYHIQLFTSEGKYITLEEILIGKDGKADTKISTSSSNLMGSGMDWEDFAGIVIKPEDLKSNFKIALSAWIKGEKGKLPLPVRNVAEDLESKRKKEKLEETVQEKEEFEEVENLQEWEERQEIEEAEVAQELEAFKEDDPSQMIKEIEELEELETIEKLKVREEIQEDVEAIAPEAEENQALDNEFQEEIENLEIQEKTIDEEQEEEIYIEELQKELDQVGNIILDQYYNKDEYWVDLDETGKDETISKEDQEASKEEPLEFPYYYVNENIVKIEKNISKINPFQPPLKNHKWLRITGKEEDLEKFYLFFNGSFVHLTFPYMDYRNIGTMYQNVYKDMIFGMVYDEQNNKKNLKYYVYGIPGRFCLQEQPYQGRTGFLYWQPVANKNQNKDKEDMGYWLLYLHAQSGVIAIPKRPTIPPVCKDIDKK